MKCIIQHMDTAQGSVRTSEGATIMQARINVISRDYQKRGLTRRAAKLLASRMVKVYPRLWAFDANGQPRYKEATV